MTQYHVYHLVDPRTAHVKYVGKSAAPKSRYRQHIKESQERQNTAKNSGSTAYSRKACGQC